MFVNNKNDRNPSIFVLNAYLIIYNNNSLLYYKGIEPITGRSTVMRPILHLIKSYNPSVPVSARSGRSVMDLDALGFFL